MNSVTLGVIILGVFIVAFAVLIIRQASRPANVPGTTGTPTNNDTGNKTPGNTPT